jgi:prepilin-type processing-associated H-X9-DG protein
MQQYAGEHGGALPAAGIDMGSFQSSWDVAMLPYLDTKSVKVADEKTFACPSDNIPRRGKMRSYAMGGNDMAPENWPADRDSATGVGLCWDQPTVLSLLGANALKEPELLPALKLSNIPVPAETLLLTEFIVPSNTVGNIRQSRVFGAAQQQQFFIDDGAQYHRGRFNYLMVDGHVELLSSLQTGSFDGTAGIWSIKKIY